MAQNLLAGNILEHKVWMSVLNQIAINVSYWQVYLISSGTIQDQDFCTAFDALVAPLYKAIMHTSVTYRGSSTQKIFPVPRFAYVIHTGNTGAGTVGGALMPTQNAGLLSRQTLLAGPAYRGRMYLPWPGTNNSSSDGKPTPTYQTNAAGLITEYISLQTIVGVSGTAEFAPILWHKKPPLTNTFTYVVGGFIGPYWATQRRRGEYGRPNTPPF